MRHCVMQSHFFIESFRDSLADFSMALVFSVNVLFFSWKVILTPEFATGLV